MSSVSLFKCIVLLALPTQFLRAQPLIDLEKTGSDEPLGLNVSYYRDTTHQLRLDEVAASSFADSFTVSSQPVLNFGLSEATYWLRFRVKNARPEAGQWLVELAYPLLDSVFFYQTQADSSWTEIVSGERIGTRKLPIPYKHFLFPIAPTDSGISTYYLRVRTESASRFPIFIHQSADFFGEVLIEEVMFGVFYGAMLVMVLYNLFLFFALQDRSYLLYCAFILLNTGAQATFNGHVQLADIAVGYANTWLLLAMFGTALFGIIFTISFLRTRHFSPFLHRLLVGGAGVAGVALGLSFILPYRISAMIAAVLFLIIPFVAWASGVVAWRKGNSPARYFVLAWTMYLIAVTLISLRTLGFIPGSMPLEIVMQAGSVLDAVLLSLALADRINVYRQERARAQEQALQAARENEQLVREQNYHLEKRVAERTEEVTAQNEELRVQQEVIGELNEQLTEQNEGLEEEVNQRTQALAQTNRRLMRQNQRLEQFASVTSHNLRGPIANILGLSNMFDRQNLDELNRQCINHLQRAASDLDLVVNDLNHLLTLNSELPGPLEDVYLEPVLQRVVEKLSASLAETQGQITTDFSEADRIYAIKPYIESVFLNLLDNAIKFRAHETSPLIRVTSARTEDHIVVSISDNGLGIDTEMYQDKLFKLYQRFHTHRAGRGVGLYLVKNQMEALGGNITVKSQVGKGTTFCLYFDAAEEKFRSDRQLRALES